MLFDLRSSGRRRTIKVVYLLLAVLMGGGLVLFGIGGGGALPGGLADMFTESRGEVSYADTERKATEKARANPKDPKLWAEAARARFNLASSPDNQAAQGEYNEKGLAELRRAGSAWEESVKLTGATGEPDLGVAAMMVQGYLALGDTKNAIKSQQLVAAARDNSGAYATLAALAYQGGDIRQGDLAADRAIDLADKDERKQLREQLDATKAQAEAQAAPQPQQRQQPAPER